MRGNHVPVLDRGLERGEARRGQRAKMSATSDGVRRREEEMTDYSSSWMTANLLGVGAGAGSVLATVDIVLRKGRRRRNRGERRDKGEVGKKNWRCGRIH